MHDDIDLQTGRTGGRLARPPFPPRVPQRERSGIVLPPIIPMTFAVALTLAAVITYEKLAPPPFKISTFVGSEEAIIASSTKAGELQAQARYEPVILQMKAVNDQNVEHVKAALQIVGANCQATYDRAKIYAQAAGTYRMAMVNAHLDQVRREQAGEVAVISFARAVGLTGNLWQRGLGDGIYDRVKPEQARLSQELDDAGQLGLDAEITGWDEGIQTPEDCLATLNNIQFMPMPAMPVISSDAASIGGGK